MIVFLNIVGSAHHFLKVKAKITRFRVKKCTCLGLQKRTSQKVSLDTLWSAFLKIDFIFNLCVIQSWQPHVFLILQSLTLSMLL